MYSQIGNNVYGYNEERRPYQTYFYKAFEYHEESHDSKFVVIRKYGKALARSYAEFRRPLAMRGFGIRSANCCPHMDPVELWVLAKLPEKFEYKKEYCQEFKDLSKALSFGENDLSGMMLVKHVKDIGFSNDRLELKEFRFEKPIMSTGLYFYILSTKQSLSASAEPHQGVQFKRLYVY
mmetsp:Transcript_42304/g.64880  ORF Transcript_42304/g.64880 Transcript_42304/m.64880 type:complete len:179 (+) Transcript_42304:1582-2118(+)